MFRHSLCLGSCWHPSGSLHLSLWTSLVVQSPKLTTHHQEARALNSGRLVDTTALMSTPSLRKSILALWFCNLFLHSATDPKVHAAHTLYPLPFLLSSNSTSSS